MPEVRTAPANWTNGLIPIILGLLIVVKAPVYGLLAILVGVALSTTYQGIEFDLPQQRYRNFYWILGFNAGNWLPLPPTQRVVLKPHSDVVTKRRGSSQASAQTMRYEHLTLLLSIPGSIIGEVMFEFSLRHRALALATGQAIADLLRVPLVVMEGA